MAETQEAVKEVAGQKGFDVGFFKRRFAAAAQAVPTSTSIAVLFNVLLSMGKRCLLKATDQEIYVEVDLGMIRHEPEFDVLLEAARTTAFVESLPHDGLMDIVVKPGKASIACGSSHMRLNTADPKEFPVFKEIVTAWCCTHYPDLRDALSKVAHARDMSGKKYLTSGICITVSGGVMELAASDTMRMAVCRIPFSGPDSRFVMPSRIADMLRTDA